jgi:UDP-glucose 4-epimerase
VEEVAGTLRMVSRVMKEFEYRAAREGDVLDSALDPTKAQTTFAWAARQTLDAGLAATWQWMRQQS